MEKKITLLLTAQHHRFLFIGVNFGGTHTILDPFGYRAIPELQELLGISPAFFRLSVGLDYSGDEICNLIDNAFV